MDSPQAPRVAIVAYGNPLRSDDGIAWHAAKLLQADPPNRVTDLICVHQLTPEIAERIAATDGVIFLDASQAGKPGEIHCAPVEPAGSEEIFSHSLSPGQMLALCEYLYGKKTDAFAVSVTGEFFDHGDALSKTLQSALPALVATVKDLAVRLARRFDSSLLELQDTSGV
jgi:hydrogenase maturation protease